MEDTSPFGKVVSIVVSTGDAERGGVDIFGGGVVREAGADDAPPTLAGTGVLAELPVEVGSALGIAEAPMGRVVRPITPLEVTGHTNWKVVMTRVLRDMEAM